VTSVIGDDPYKAKDNEVLIKGGETSPSYVLILLLKSRFERASHTGPERKRSEEEEAELSLKKQQKGEGSRERIQNRTEQASSLRLNHRIHVLQSKGREKQRKHSSRNRQARPGNRPRENGFGGTISSSCYSNSSVAIKAWTGDGKFGVCRGD